MNNKGKTSFLTTRSVLKALATICFIMVFCPSFLVSCSGQKVEVDVMTAIEGYKSMGEVVVEPHPIMILCILFPVAIFVFLFIKRFGDQKSAAIIFLSCAVDMVIWILFRSKVKELEESGITVKTTSWYVINMISMILILLLTVLVIFCKLQMDADLIMLLSGEIIRDKIKQVTSNKDWAAKPGKIRVSDIDNANGEADYNKFCPNCGSPVESGDIYCASCGTVIPLIGETEQDRIDIGQISKADSRMQVSAPSIGKLIDKVKSIPVFALAGAGLAIVLLVGGILFVSNSAKTIDLDKYLSIETSGYEGYGTAEVKLDWEAMEKDHGSSMIFTEEAKKEAGGFLFLTTPMDYIKDCVKVELDPVNNLSNGDTVTYKWAVKDELSKYLKCKFKYEDGEYIVSGLDAVGSFDVFSDIDIEFSGVSPYGEAKINYTGSELSVYDFECYPTDDLKNGDKIQVTLKDPNMTYFANQFGKVPESTAKEYTVSGLDEYIKSLEDINDEDKNRLKDEAVNAVKSYIQSYEDDTAFSDEPEYMGYIVGLCKSEPVWDWENYNNLYFIYKASVTSSDSTIGDLYLPVQFANVFKIQNGSIDSIIPNEVTSYDKRNSLFDCYQHLVEGYQADYDFTFGDGFEKYGNYEIVSSLNDISAASKEIIHNDAEQVIKNHMEQEYGYRAIISNLEYEGEYLLTAKTQGDRLQENNSYIVVYTADISSPDHLFKTITVYCPVKYDGVIRLSDDTVAYVGTGGVEGYFELPDYWYRFDFGYIDGAEMFKDMIEPCRDDYDFEISEGLKQFGE